MLQPSRLPRLFLPPFFVIYMLRPSLPPWLQIVDSVISVAFAAYKGDHRPQKAHSRRLSRLWGWFRGSGKGGEERGDGEKEGTRGCQCHSCVKAREMFGE